MAKAFIIFILMLTTFNVSANSFYKSGKLYNINELMNNINKDIEDYCKRNLSKFSKEIQGNNQQETRKNNRYQLKIGNSGHNHSTQTFNKALSGRQQQINLDACFDVEKQKFNNIINIYYKNSNNDKEFLNCYDNVREERNKSISDNFSSCLNNMRKEKCRYILDTDFSPNEKAIKYKNCLM